jgi:hypothetical protein
MTVVLVAVCLTNNRTKYIYSIQHNSRWTGFDQSTTERQGHHGDETGPIHARSGLVARPGRLDRKIEFPNPLLLLLLLLFTTPPPPNIFCVDYNIAILRLACGPLLSRHRRRPLRSCPGRLWDPAIAFSCRFLVSRNTVFFCY